MRLIKVYLEKEHKQLNNMRTKLVTFLALISLFVCTKSLKAENETREVEAFSEISLRVAATVYLEQGETQSVEIIAKNSTLEDLITEVKGRELIIRFPNRNFFWQDFNPGKIDIYITVPEIDALSISGSGDIKNDSPIKSRILNLAVSGSGDILLDNIEAERVSASISGSGDIDMKGAGKSEDLSVSISGSGDFKGIDFAADDVNVRIAGSGGASVFAEKNLNVRIAGSGDVVYKGYPLVDQAIVGSGDVKEY